MNVKIRLQRFGSKKRPYYRIVAAPNSKKRDGRFLEIIGLYHPLSEKEPVRLKKDRIMYWLQAGAQPSDTVKNIFTKDGLWKEFTGGRSIKKKKKSQPSEVLSESNNEKAGISEEPSTAE